MIPRCVLRVAVGWLLDRLFGEAEPLESNREFFAFPPPPA